MHLRERVATPSARSRKPAASVLLHDLALPKCDAGLILSATLAQHLELRPLIDERVDLGDAPGHANVGHKAMTLIHSALAGGDCIDDADALRAESTQAVLGHAVLAPSTLDSRGMYRVVETRISDGAWEYVMPREQPSDTAFAEGTPDASGGSRLARRRGMRG